MSDTELNMILSVEDEMSEPAATAREELTAMAAGPYEGEMMIEASMDGDAFEQVGELTEEAMKAEAATEDTADAVRDLGSAASAASDDMDQLAAATGGVAAAEVDQAAANDDMGDSLGDVGSAATTADVSIRGTTGGIRALTGVLKTAGKEAGVGKEALAGMSTGSRLLMQSTRLLSGGLAAVGGLLAAIPGWGWAAAAAVTTTAVAWKTNAGDMKDIAMGIRVEWTKLFTAIKDGFTSLGPPTKRAADSTAEYARQNRLLAPAMKVVDSWQNNLSQGWADMTRKYREVGAAQNTATAAMERGAAASSRLVAATNNVRAANAAYISSVRALEDAQLRVVTSAQGITGAQINEKQATLDLKQAWASHNALLESGIATAEEVEQSTLDVERAQLNAEQSTTSSTTAVRDNKRAIEDIPGASLLATLAYRVMKAASDEYTAANNEATGAADGLQRTIDMANASGYWDMAAEASAALAQMRADIGATVEAQNQLDPSLRHSPSLVDKVQKGVSDMIMEYQRLGANTSGVMQPVSKTPVVLPAPAGTPGKQTIIKQLHIHPKNTADYKRIMRDLEREVRLQG